jgi:arylsulfatase A-like enzyme
MSLTKAGLPAALALGAGIGAWAIAPSAPATSPNTLGAPAQPNIVMIQSDDQDLMLMRAMRKTKRLIGARGATFRNHFTNWPLCCPSRATQLTGQYAHNHGVLGNGLPTGGYQKFPREDNLAVWLAAAGYEVGHVGKFLNAYGNVDRPETPYNDRTEVPPGWTDWRTSVGGEVYRYYRYVQNRWSEEWGGPREGALLGYGSAIGDFKTDVNTADAVGLIRKYARGTAPFYLQVDYLAPHDGRPNQPGGMPRPPFNCGDGAKPAARHAHAFDRRRLPATQYPSFNEADVSDKPSFVSGLPELTPQAVENITSRYRCRLESMLAVDDGVAAIIKRLRSTGELRNTYVLYTSDNGFLQGQHRIKYGKNRVYEPSIRVPLLLRGPGVPAGVQVRSLTSNADLATTVIELTGAPATRQPDGLSLIPPTEAPSEQNGRELLIETNQFTAVRTQRYKWVEYGDGFAELYDLDRDPHELDNVAGDPDYLTVQVHLATRLAALRECSGASCTQTP